MNNYDIIELLIKSNINVFLKDIKGKDALFYLKKSANSKSIFFLENYINTEKRKKKSRDKDSLKNFIENFDKNPIDEM